MARIAVVTENTESVIATMAPMAGIEIAGSRTDFICWEWDDPDPDHLSTVEGLSEYKGTIPLS